ncbi:MAG: hypothetical protein EON85_08790, partial [Brevundimonas sp.]
MPSSPHWAPTTATFAKTLLRRSGFRNAGAAYSGGIARCPVQSAEYSAIAVAKAQSSQGVSASISAASTVQPHQMRRPAGALRCPSMSNAEPSASTNAFIRVTRSRRVSSSIAITRGSTIFRQTDVVDRMSGVSARYLTHAVRETHASSAAAFASVRAISASRPPTDRPHSTPSIQSSSVQTEKVFSIDPAPNNRSNPLSSRRRRTLGTGLGGSYRSSRSTARGDNAATPRPASPPSAFWKLKVTTS